MRTGGPDPPTLFDHEKLKINEKIYIKNYIFSSILFLFFLLRHSFVPRSQHCLLKKNSNLTYVRISFSLKLTFVKIENVLNLMAITVWINSENSAPLGVYEAKSGSNTGLFLTLHNFKIVKLRMKKEVEKRKSSV